MRKCAGVTGLFVVGFLCVACVADDRAASQPSAAAADGPTSRPGIQSADVVTTKPTAASAKPGAVAVKQITPRTKPGEVPVKPGPAPAAVLSSGDPKVDEILDKLEVKGQAIKGLACELTYKYVTVFPVEDAQIKQGELLFARAEPNPRFLIHFTKLIADGVIVEHGEYFLFDGEWLTERNDRGKTVTKRQIVRKGKRVNPFRLGKGPFPLPFGQKREEILRTFTVTLEAPAAGDPENADHLHCVPLPRTELATKYSRVEMYVDKKIELPVRIVTERIKDKNRIEVDFKKIDTDEAPAMSRFQIDEPRGYTVTIEPLPPMPKHGTAPTGEP